MVQQYKQVQAQRVSRQGGPQKIEVKNIVSSLQKTSVVRNSLFDLPAMPLVRFALAPQC